MRRKAQPCLICKRMAPTRKSYAICGSECGALVVAYAEVDDLFGYVLRHADIVGGIKAARELLKPLAACDVL